MKADPSVPRPDVRYPSFDNVPSNQPAPPHQQHPLMNKPPPPHMHPVYTPPTYSGDYRQDGYCGMTIRLIVFHIFNAILGISAFSIVVTGLSLSIGLLPLCCFGLVIFRALLYIVRFLAQLDVHLYNYISPVEEHVYVNIPERAGFHGLEGERLAPSLSSFSPLALMATLYFLSIKFLFGILSSVVVLSAFAIPVSALVDTDDMDLGDMDPSGISINTDDPITLTLTIVCSFIISVALMHVLARLSRGATRFFCCERFSTYRYVQSMQFYNNPGYPAATASYGTTY